jgi:hypothetical protein
MQKKYNYCKLQGTGKFRDLESTIGRRIDEDFNFISLDVIKKIFNKCEFEYIIRPDKDIIFNEWLQEQKK